MQTLTWENSIWFLDVDDTVLDTDGAHEFGAQWAKLRLAQTIGDNAAEKLITLFNQKYWFIRQGYSAKDPADWTKIPGGQAAYEALLDRIRGYQPDVITEFGAAKLWSREVLLKLCADELQLPVSGELAEQAAAAFWQGVSQKATVLPDAANLIAAIRGRGRSIHLFTSSDGRLQYDSTSQTFRYDPAKSRQHKLERIERNRSAGLSFDTLTTGDPVDKPALSGFQLMIGNAARFLNQLIEPENCVMVGDSYQGDLAIPHDQLNFGLCVWYRKKYPNTAWLDSRLVSVGDLRLVTGFFSNETV